MHRIDQVQPQEVIPNPIEYKVVFYGTYWPLFGWTLLHLLMNAFASTLIVPLFFTFPYSIYCLCKYVSFNVRII